jgi:hypothetical protein
MTPAAWIAVGCFGLISLFCAVIVIGIIVGAQEDDDDYD